MTDLSQRGVRIGNESLTFVPKGSKVRPLRDQVFVEPLEYPSRIQVTGFKTLRGIVRAIGPGCYPKLYDGPKGRRSKSWLSKAFRPCDVKVGDTVELGGVEIGGYLFQSVRWGDKDCIICQEADIALILEN